MIQAVNKHQGLLRASVANIGQDHRLGANEAPPAIISIFLGAELDKVFETLEAGAGDPMLSSPGQGHEPRPLRPERAGSTRPGGSPDPGLGVPSPPSGLEEKSCMKCIDGE